MNNLNSYDQERITEVNNSIQLATRREKFPYELFYTLRTNGRTFIFFQTRPIFDTILLLAAVVSCFPEELIIAK